MAMNTDHGPPEEDDLLPCGHTLREVWEAWDDGHVPDHPHMSRCSHCAAALDGLQVLDGYVRSARTAEADEARAAEADGSAAAGADAVAARVMEIVRLELRPGRTLPLGAPDEDGWIVEAAAAKAFRSAAETLPGVRAGSCRILPADADGTARRGPLPGGTVPRGPVSVRLQVTGDLSRPVPELAEEVRARITEAAHDDLGMDVRSVDVQVIDVFVDLAMDVSLGGSLDVHGGGDLDTGPGTALGLDAGPEARGSGSRGQGRRGGGGRLR
ncbi:Asp23/Gls24 family envelope stress response protein [Streptomyces sp. Z26]|uniref:Asp23/Gls24 family envelope stress response protein n=1 Tax=Streptomyces sp. Z26 TaxID=2500177 RepID=UPI000EF1352E|nr:Asp23/Gls24 family envelope stress response protein [Streptomyces sp. Z26]RLL67740.1 Asp23/Gls24 family envelope stress response protein [Streptomyces sp. Z26]